MGKGRVSAVKRRVASRSQPTPRSAELKGHAHFADREDREKSGKLENLGNTCRYWNWPLVARRAVQGAEPVQTASAEFFQGNGGAVNTGLPHFVLFSKSVASSRGPGTASSPTGWRFVLKSDDETQCVEGSDEEAGASPDRLELMAVVRGLEALDQPSRVTLVTGSSSIRRGMRFGLDIWRENRWRWERFGAMAPIKHGDLWRRVDRALRFHDVACREVRSGGCSDDLAEPRAFVRAELRSDGANAMRAADRPRWLRTRGAIGSATRSICRVVTAPYYWLFGWRGLCRDDQRLVIAAH